MLSQDTRYLVERFVEKFGVDVLERRLQDACDDRENGVLTIIVNEGVHPHASQHSRGEVFIASRGNIDFSSKASATNAIRVILQRVATKLKSRIWRQVYIVPFGPSVLSMQIKALVFQVSHLDTVDVLHAGSGTYFDIDINIRDVAIAADGKETADSDTVTSAN